MRTKKQFRALLNLKSLSVILCIAAVLAAFPSCGKNKSAETLLPNPPKTPTMAGNDTIWSQVDELPVYPGGDAAILKYLAENTKYPETAKTNGTQGRVIVKFCVTSKGNVNACEIFNSVSPEIDAEALRVVSTLAKFEPGKVAGKPVAVWYKVPITFALK